MALIPWMCLTGCSDYTVEPEPVDPVPADLSSLSVTPTTVEFGLFQPDGAGTSAVTLLAEGAVVTLDHALVEGAGFDLAWDHAGVVLQPGDAVVLDLAFTAPGPGSHTGTLRVTSDADEGGDLLVPLTADVAGPEIALTPEEQEIALYGVGTVDIASVGVLPLTVTAVDSTDNLAISGLDAAPVLAPGEQVPVTVSCLAAGEGEVTVYSDAVSTPVATARVMCTCEVVFAFLPGWHDSNNGDWPAEVWYDTSDYGPCTVRSADVDYGFTYQDLVETEASVVLISDISGGEEEYSEAQVQAIWDYLRTVDGGLVVSYLLAWQYEDRELYENVEIAEWLGVDPTKVDPQFYETGIDISDWNPSHPLLHNVDPTTKSYDFSYYFEAQRCTTATWDEALLPGAQIVASSVHRDGAVEIAYETDGRRNVWFTAFVDIWARQMMYNAIMWTAGYDPGDPEWPE